MVKNGGLSSYAWVGEQEPLYDLSHINGLFKPNCKPCNLSRRRPSGTLLTYGGFGFWCVRWWGRCAYWKRVQETTERFADAKFNKHGEQSPEQTYPGCVTMSTGPGLAFHSPATISMSPEGALPIVSWRPS